MIMTEEEQRYYGFVIQFSQEDKKLCYENLKTVYLFAFMCRMYNLDAETDFVKNLEDKTQSLRIHVRGPSLVIADLQKRWEVDRFEKCTIKVIY